MKIYLAGPLFTIAERTFNVQLKNLLVEAGHEVWLPQEREPRDKSPTEIFKMDVEGLDWAEIIIANMDGPDPDSGTSWECGYAYGRGKPIVTYRTDFRAGGDAKICHFNIMLALSTRVHVDSSASQDLNILVDGLVMALEAASEGVWA